MNKKPSRPSQRNVVFVVRLMKAFKELRENTVLKGKLIQRSH